MGAVMTSTLEPLPSARRARLATALPALLTVAVSLGAPISVAAAAERARAVTTPTFPVPASARVHGATRSNQAAAAATTTPTTTYAPSGGAPAPSATPGSVGGASAPSTAPSPAGAAASAAKLVPTAGTPAAPTTTATAAVAPAGAQTTAPASGAPAKASEGDRPLSTGAVVIAVLAALLVLVCAAWALARRSAFEPHWLLSLRHAMAEAGFRASATWSEFTDWARLGR
jgi:hypothetical protein